MKRPRAFSLVAAWCCLGLLIQAGVLFRPWAAYMKAHTTAPFLWQVVPVIALGFAAWQTVGLWEMRRFHRWFAVAFFIWWSFTLTWKGFFGPGLPTSKPIRATVVFSIMVGLNLVSAWYLARLGLRKSATQLQNPTGNPLGK